MIFVSFSVPFSIEQKSQSVCSVPPVGVEVGVAVVVVVTIDVGVDQPGLGLSLSLTLVEEPVVGPDTSVVGSGEGMVSKGAVDESRVRLSFSLTLVEEPVVGPAVDIGVDGGAHHSRSMAKTTNSPQRVKGVHARVGLGLSNGSGGQGNL